MTDPKELEKIRERELDITRERIQKIIDAGGWFGGRMGRWAMGPKRVRQSVGRASAGGEDSTQDRIQKVIDAGGWVGRLGGG